MYLWFLTKIWIWKPRVIDYYIGCKRFPIEYNCCHGWCYDNSFDRRNLVHDLRTLTVPFNAGSTSSAWKEEKKRAERKRKYPENYWVALNHWESGNTLKVEMLALSMLDVITESQRLSCKCGAARKKRQQDG